jgi:hypothetical protein
MSVKDIIKRLEASVLLADSHPETWPRVAVQDAVDILNALKAGQALADKGERLDWYNGYGRCFDCDVDRDTSSRNTDWRPTPHREGCEWVALLSAFGVTP